MTYVFDIDGTLCTKAVDFDYEVSEPIRERINVVNELYEAGNTIIMQTARGMGRHANNPQKAIQEFYAMTTEQLEKWGVKYHALFLGKPAGDIYIDDKGIRDEDFFRNEFRP
jgi:histidinol phosphatase-like enzyme